MAISAKPESGGENYDIIFLSSPSFRKACPEKSGSTPTSCLSRGEVVGSKIELFPLLPKLQNIILYYLRVFKHPPVFVSVNSNLVLANEFIAFGIKLNIYQIGMWFSIQLNNQLKSWAIKINYIISD
jgi:hypothetical protein